MNKSIKRKISLALKFLSKSIIENNKINNNEKLDQFNTVANLQKIVNNYNELEPIIMKFLENKEKCNEDKER